MDCPHCLGLWIAMPFAWWLARTPAGWVVAWLGIAGGASLAELAAEHAVSTITVHRDLEQLSRDGLVVRFHGGARAASAPDGGEQRPGTAWDRRIREGSEAKDAIAAHARGMVGNGETIFLDARPSDALALSLRTKAPVFVETKVLDQAKSLDVTTDQADRERLQRWLESLDPDDLGYKM